MKIAPDNPLAFNNLGVALFETGKLDEAQDHLRTALRIAPNYAEAHNNLGNLLLERGQIDAAKAAYQQAIASHSGFAEAHYNLGVIAQRENDTQAAEAAYLRAIKLRPNHVDALRNLGALLKNSGALHKAKAATLRALEFRPDHVETLVNLGLIQTELEEHRDAVRVFDRALALDGDNLDALLGSADALQELGQYRRAIDMLDRARKAHPQSIKPVANTGLMLQRQGRIDDALALYEEALESYPGEGSLYVNRALAYRELGETEAAIADFQKALEVAPENDTAARSVASWPVGVLDAAQVAELRRFFEAYGNKIKSVSARHFFAADILRHEGNLDAAFDAIQRANAEERKNFGPRVNEAREKLLGAAAKVAAWQPAPPPAESGELGSIFVLGTSRSGKSLLEGLLALSPFIHPLFEAIKTFGDGDAVMSFADVFYPDPATLAAQGIRAVTSTNPYSIGVLTQLADRLPNARFVFVRRDPVDVGAEMFANAYARANAYSYDAQAAMAYIAAYNDLGDLLIAKLGSRGVLVNFEDILENAGGIVSRIQAVAGIDPNTANAPELPPTLRKHSIFRAQFEALLEKPLKTS
jgi:tetratricopeptide (TPR) repeat protein